jgi:predicted ATPase
MKSVHIKTVGLKNYKSIASCSVELGTINVLVGRNGAGKSNLLDALRFVKESLEYSLDYAIKTRGGVDNVRRRSTGHPHNFKIYLEVRLPGSYEARYGFEISVAKRGVFFVKKETLQVFNAKGKRCVFYRVEDGQVVGATFDTMPDEFHNSNRGVVETAESAGRGKRWIKEHFRRDHYSETADMPRLTQKMDMQLVRSRCPSFDKLCRELAKLKDQA